MDSNSRSYFDGLTLEVADCEVEAGEESSFSCECCGNLSRMVQGYVHRRDAETVACYYVHWTVGASLETHPANFDLIIGRWGEGTAPADRCAVSLINFENEGRPGVMVINAAERAVAENANTGIVTTREDVVGTPFAKTVFALFDAIILGDPRLH